MAAKYNLSKAEVLREISKCANDPVYFIKNYCRIAHPIKGEIPFRTYEFQEELLRDFEKNRFNIILKARQLGISTVTAAYILWLMLFRRNKFILTVATKRDTASNINKKVRGMFELLPDFLKVVEIKTDNKYEFALSNGSFIKAESSRSNSGRSEGLSLLVLDEAAHIENLGGDDGLWTGIYPTLSTGGACIALSTPAGIGNWFHEKCVDSEEGRNEFKLTVLPWDVHPDRDEEWFEAETRAMNKRQVAQELLCSFNQSGATVVDSDVLERIYHYQQQKNRITGFINAEPLYRTWIKNELWVWEDAVPGSKYLISCDIASGDGVDNSAVIIYNINSSSIVAVYKGQIYSDILAEKIFELGMEYNQALIVVENNSLGKAVLRSLETNNYPNILYSRPNNEYYVSTYNGINDNSAKAGFNTNMNTKILCVNKMEEYLRNNWINVMCPQILKELKTFIWKSNGKSGASGTNHDDLVMALSLLVYILDTVVDQNVLTIEQQRAMSSAFSSSRRTIDMNSMKNPGVGLSPYRNTKNEEKEKVRKYPALFRG